MFRRAFSHMASALVGVAIACGMSAPVLPAMPTGTSASVYRKRRRAAAARRWPSSRRPDRHSTPKTRDHQARKARRRVQRRRK